MRSALFWVIAQHTQCGSKVLGLIFFQIEETYLFLIKSKLYWHIYRFLCGRTVSEKLLKIPHFGPSLIRQLRLLGSQQHPQSGVLLTSFSTWGTENSLAEINLESTGVIKGCNNFFGQKLANTCGRAHYRATKKISGAERSWTDPLNALQEAIHYSFIKFCTYCFSLWYELFVHYALTVEKNYQHGLDAEPLEFQFLRPRGRLTNPFRTLWLCFGVVGKTSGLISRNNFV